MAKEWLEALGKREGKTAYRLSLVASVALRYTGIRLCARQQNAQTSSSRRSAKRNFNLSIRFPGRVTSSALAGNFALTVPHTRRS